MQQEIEECIKKIFPKYQPSSYSRFTDCFQEIENEDRPLCEEKTILDKRFDINISEIKKGHERRSSIIIKCIPSSLGPVNFYFLLQNFSKKMNYFFIPGYVSTSKKFMYAFVNVACNKEIISIVEGLTTIKNKYGFYCGFDFRYLEIYFSKTQGYKALHKKYKTKEVNDFVIS